MPKPQTLRERGLPHPPLGLVYFDSRDPILDALLVPQGECATCEDVGHVSRPDKHGTKYNQWVRCPTCDGHIGPSLLIRAECVEAIDDLLTTEFGDEDKWSWEHWQTHKVKIRNAILSALNVVVPEAVGIAYDDWRQKAAMLETVDGKRHGIDRRTVALLAKD